MFMAYLWLASPMNVHAVVMTQLFFATGLNIARGLFPSELPAQILSSFFSSTRLHSAYDHLNIRCTYWTLQIANGPMYNYLQLLVTSFLRLHLFIYKWRIHLNPRHFIMFRSMLVFKAKGHWSQAGYLWLLIEHILSYPYVQAVTWGCACHTALNNNKQKQKQKTNTFDEETNLILILRYRTMIHSSWFFRLRVGNEADNLTPDNPVLHWLYTVRRVHWIHTCDLSNGRMLRGKLVAEEVGPSMRSRSRPPRSPPLVSTPSPGSS
jgi:hypothetical protein